MSLGQGAATLIGLAVIAVLVIVDVVLANDQVPGNTPSEVIRWISRYTAAVPFGLGVLMGHWFHPGDDFESILDRGPVWLIVIGVVIGVGGPIVGWRRRLPAWPWAVTGAVLGALLWPV